MLRTGLIIAFFVLLCDQAHKWYMLAILEIDRIPPITVTPFFNLVMVWNRGISFGMFQNGEHSPLIFSIIAILVSIGFAWWLRYTDRLLPALAIGAIIGGALGNTIDRLRFGAVADFFDVHVAGYHWPAFNIADSAVVIGAIMLIIDSFISYDKTEQDENGKTS